MNKLSDFLHQTFMQVQALGCGLQNRVEGRWINRLLDYLSEPGGDGIVIGRVQATKLLNDAK